MGNISIKPKTIKSTERGQESLSREEANHPAPLPLPTKANHIRWAVSSMQGWRVDMEDAHVVVELREVEGEAGELLKLDQTHYFFAIFDGHGGKYAARYASNNLFSVLAKRPEFIQYARLASQGEKNEQRCLGKEKELLQRALEDAFVELDLRMLQKMVEENLFDLPAETSLSNKHDSGDDWDISLIDPELESIYPPFHPASGTTVTAAFVTPTMIVCANVGDSRTILDGCPLSTDHKPSLPLECDRILSACGTVTFGRVDGQLAVSRALGDFEFKGYTQEHLLSEARKMDLEAQRNFAQSLKVTPFPDVLFHFRNPEVDKCLVLACDGIWDVMSNLVCNKFVKDLCGRGEQDAGRIAEEILDACLEHGSRDNMTILIGLLPAQRIGPSFAGGVVKRRKKKHRIHLLHVA
jgi:serine/threonine protein phosphatase PrpC